MSRRNQWVTAEKAAIRAAYWLADNFTRMPRQSSEISDYHVDEMKKAGGLCVSTLIHMSDCYELVPALTESVDGMYGMFYPEKGGGSISGGGYISTEQLLSTYARLAIMGFGDADFARLAEAFDGHLAAIRKSKSGRIVCRSISYAIWYDAWKKRGDYFVAPASANHLEPGFTVNQAGTHFLFIDDQGEGGKLMIFGPLVITRGNLKTLICQSDSKYGSVLSEYIKSTNARRTK